MQPQLKSYTRENFLDALSKRTCNVIFTKADSSARQMQCTRNFDMIPKDRHPKPKDPSAEDYKPIKENLEIVRVFDLEEGEWRSFRVESVTHFNVV